MAPVPTIVRSRSTVVNDCDDLYLLQDRNGNSKSRSISPSQISQQIAHSLENAFQIIVSSAEPQRQQVQEPF